MNLNQGLRWLKNRKHLLIMPLYCIFYLAMFAYVESYDGRCYILHSQIDDLIPFCEYFIVPYLLWYFYMIVTVVRFGLLNDGGKEHNKMAAVLCTGMTVFLIISMVFPNGQNLRPSAEELTGSSVFIEAVRVLYSVDTSTNIFPSIHVFNSLACCGAWMRDESIRSNKIYASIVLLLTGSIIASTMFLKQHTVIDVIAAFVLYGACYAVFYGKIFEILPARYKKGEI